MPAQTPLDPQTELGVPPAALPRHVAIIMDGNGRWAKQRGLPRMEGHRAGVEALRRTLTHCGRLNIPYLTVFSFSSENWRRPPAEVHALMSLAAVQLVAQREDLLANNVRLRHIGRREGLPAEVLAELDRTMEATADCTGTTLGLALNYGAREELLHAVRMLAGEVAANLLSLDEIDEARFSAALYTAGLPDPDLLVRTAGELRISNFLLWQISYAELYVTPVLWPEFGPEQFNAAVQAFARRERRFGDVAPPAAPPGAP